MGNYFSLLATFLSFGVRNQAGNQEVVLLLGNSFSLWRRTTGQLFLSFGTFRGPRPVVARTLGNISLFRQYHERIRIGPVGADRRRDTSSA